MKALINIIKTIISIFKGKVKEMDDAIVQTNPSYVLDEAIEEANNIVEDYNRKLVEFKTQQEDNNNKIKECEAKLSEIQNGIKRASKDGDVESVKFGNSLYKDKERELVSLYELKEQIDLGIVEFEGFVREAIKEVDRLDMEKKKLLVQLENAKIKEGIMNIRSSIKTGKPNTYNTKFNQVKEQINKKVQQVNALESLNKGSSSKNKYFDKI